MRFLFVISLAVGSAAAAPIPKELKKADDKTRIVGTWAMTRCNVSGKDTTASWQTITFDADGGVRAHSREERLILEFTTALDPVATPKRMPWRNKQTGDAMYECVYRLADGGLTIVVPHDHKTPPTSLDQAPRVTVYEFKRAAAK
jgi:uncharacterized protein (TIGR03067 family)